MSTPVVRDQTGGRPGRPEEHSRRGLDAGVPPPAAARAHVAAGSQGFQGYGLSILRIRYLVPRMLFCVVFSRLAILRIEGCLNSTLWNPLRKWSGGASRHSASPPRGSPARARMAALRQTPGRPKGDRRVCRPAAAAGAAPCDRYIISSLYHSIVYHLILHYIVLYDIILYYIVVLYNVMLWFMCILHRLAC